MFDSFALDRFTWNEKIMFDQKQADISKFVKLVGVWM
jgi:hypothetical protein